MHYFLAKTDPKTYSIDDFAKEKITTWSGVRNPVAVKVLQSMRKGDRVFIYHSQGEGAIRGIARVVGNSRPDPKDAKSWLVDFAFMRAYTEPFITIKEIKRIQAFKDFDLVRVSRLSTMTVPLHVVAWLRENGLQV